jgi:hypothetical protein
MNVNCSIDTSLTLGRYVFEASFWLRDWRLTAETHSSSAIKVLQIGPLCLCITNMKKLKELYLSGEAELVTSEDLIDM